MINQKTIKLMFCFILLSFLDKLKKYIVKKKKFLLKITNLKTWSDKHSLNEVEQNKIIVKIF